LISGAVARTPATWRICPARGASLGKIVPLKWMPVGGKVNLLVKGSDTRLNLGAQTVRSVAQIRKAVSRLMPGRENKLILEGMGLFANVNRWRQAKIEQTRHAAEQKALARGASPEEAREAAEKAVRRRRRRLLSS
jgi:hypothetical protein